MTYILVILTCFIVDLWLAISWSALCRRSVGAPGRDQSLVVGSQQSVESYWIKSRRPCLNGETGEAGGDISFSEVLSGVDATVDVALRCMKTERGSEGVGNRRTGVIKNVNNITAHPHPRPQTQIIQERFWISIFNEIDMIDGYFVIYL